MVTEDCDNCMKTVWMCSCTDLKQTLFQTEMLLLW